MTASEIDQFADKPPGDGGLLTRNARIVHCKHIADIQYSIPALPNNVSRNAFAPVAKTLLLDPELPERKFKVGIIGAGVAGLFTGMLFDYLNKEHKLDVEYEILEKNGEERVGGRLYTHYFDKTGRDVKGNHDYFDVGAMRFPKSDVMRPTFELFKKLGMEPYKVPSDPKDWNPERGDLIPYHLEGNNTVELFNDVSHIHKKGEKEAAKDFGITGLPEYETKRPPSDLINDEIKPYLDRLGFNAAAGWKHLMRVGDNKSVRQYLLETLDYNTTQWLETASYATGWYDQALSEFILENANFEYKGPWFCVEGGAQQTALRMLKKINEPRPGRKPERVFFQETVTKIERLKVPLEENPTGQRVAVHVVGTEKPHVAGTKKRREYDAVFNSAPLGAMQRMDLNGLYLNWGTKQAIRALGYGASCKAGIRFKKMWWRKSEKYNFDIDGGGVSHTDLPIRMCVYPSYNLNDVAEGPGVLLCSYSWSSDAQRLGTLISRDSPKNEEELKVLLLENLAKLHANEAKGWPYEKLLTELESLYDGHYAYDWYNDKGTYGAFAYFGPGQFSQMYPEIISNDGVHVIIGEVASSHHAWVVGAIESAIRGVYQFLCRNSQHSKRCDEILQKYNRGEICEPWGPIPREFDRTNDMEALAPDTGKAIKDDPKLAGRANGNGEILRQGVVFETIRVSQKKDRLDPSLIKKEDVKPFTIFGTGK